MGLEWEQVIVNAADPAGLGRWWADALGWVVVDDSPDEFEIRPSPDRLPGLLFVSVGELTAERGRLHLDFRPEDHQAEVERLLAMGARRVEARADDQPWVTLTDPEGNEFCVLGERTG